MDRWQPAAATAASAFFGASLAILMFSRASASVASSSAASSPPEAAEETACEKQERPRLKPQLSMRSKLLDSPLPKSWQPSPPLPPGSPSRGGQRRVTQFVDEISDAVEAKKEDDAARVVVVGVAGGTGSGKTTLAQAIREGLRSKIAYISHDNYYKDISYMTLEERNEHNFDHPDSLDTALMYEDLLRLKSGEAVDIPTYDFTTHSRTSVKQRIDPQKIILVEGILIFADEKLRSLIDVKIFVDTADDIRLMRRLERDMHERGRTASSVIQQYLKTVRPMHAKYVEPSKDFADVIVPVGLNEVALDLIVSRLRFADGS